VSAVPNDESGSPEGRACAVRHSLKNRLAAIRNAAFYLARKAGKAGLLESDPRVAQFFELIDRELTAVDDVVATKVTVEHLLGDTESTKPSP
jgi:hypothetical protein